MSWTDAAQIGATVIASLGGAGALILALSGWLGKVWANRLMEKEKQAHSIELEELRSSLQQAAAKELKTLATKLEAEKSDRLDRLTIYRASIDLLAPIAANVEMITMGKRGLLSPQELLDFEAQRLRLYAYLAMHAPQPVMDAHDALTELMLEVIMDGKTTTWPEFRRTALQFLNEVRKDVGIQEQTAPIAYSGNR